MHDWLNMARLKLQFGRRSLRRFHYGWLVAPGALCNSAEKADTGFGDELDRAARATGYKVL